MPMYKDCGVLPTALSLADRGRPGSYVPVASVLMWSAGRLRLVRQFIWSDFVQPSAYAAKATAQLMAQRAIDCGEVVKSPPAAE